MNTIVGSTPLPGAAAAPSRPRLDHKTGKGTWAIFTALLLAGVVYTAYSIATDYAGSGEHTTAVWPFVLLGLALLIALGFEFVNGFHDTANAVATVIYTQLARRPTPRSSGRACMELYRRAHEFSGAVAFAIVSLLPIELILQGSRAARAFRDGVRFAGRGHPLESAHLGAAACRLRARTRMIGSIVGVGIANAADESRPRRHLRRGLESQAAQNRQGAASFRRWSASSSRRSFCYG